MPQQNPAPTVVAVYELVVMRYRRVAEFRLTPTGTVELTPAETDGCPMARRWFRNGLSVPGTAQTVTVRDGPDFLRALLLLRGLTYCRVVDESPGPAGAVAPAAAIDRSPSGPGTEPGVTR